MLRLGYSLFLRVGNLHQKSARKLGCRMCLSATTDKFPSQFPVNSRRTGKHDSKGGRNALICFPRASPKGSGSEATLDRRRKYLKMIRNLERAKGFEPSTPTL